MTRADRAPWMDDVDPVALDAVRARWRRGMPDADLQRLALALTVPHDDCGVPAGVECVNLRDGGEIRFGFHISRGQAAGVTWPPTTEQELAGERQRRRSEHRPAPSGVPSDTDREWYR